ncbi:hypothetical protein EV361DRAFT_20524 [Lentinula raphanica]|uniref:Bacteriophage T5 Orf172 DNA-binding domain-containing protein n=1 Tax=Lentinula raphanica TaxID=153919 RepID=A0AA38U844_9AGAR|nr:hypothetical protein F5878DRAFT_373287 [Lentinula raphanica]KAJ3964869.1 hypothetical protein EV361DRAFT_20524 [Lentinula raphanica]
MQSPSVFALDAKRSSRILSKLSSQAYIRSISSKDRSGWVYVFYEVGSHGGVFKVGRTNNLRRRMSEWEATCSGKQRIWLGALWTPFAHKTEYLTHLELEARCVCRPRFLCDCGAVHIEKFIFAGDPLEVYEGSIKPVIQRVVTSVFADALASGPRRNRVIPTLSKPEVSTSTDSL